MSEQSPADAAPADAATPIDGLRAFQQAVRDAFARLAAADAPREVWICDRSFADWPLGERAVVASLQAWARSHRRLTVLACDDQVLARTHPRWARWQRDWSHIVEGRVLEDIEPGDCPTWLHAPGVCNLRLIDAQRHRGLLHPGDLRVEQGMRAGIDAFAQRSRPGFAVTVLGL